MDYGMKGNVALVTGGSSGIGRAAALIFARECAKVVVTGRNEERCRETVEMIKAEGGEAVYFIADVCVEEQVKDLVDFTVKTYGKLDYAFNNAGKAFGSPQPLHELPTQIYRDVYETNVMALYFCMKYEIPYMLKAGKGAIVNNCSNASITTTRRGSVYGTSKFAAYGLTRAAAIDYADVNIRINAVAPGATDTPMIAGAMKANPAKIQAIFDAIPDKRIGRPEESANAAVYLCSDLASHIIGELVVVDGGQNLLQ